VGTESNVGLEIQSAQDHRSVFAQLGRGSSVFEPRPVFSPDGRTVVAGFTSAEDQIAAVVEAASGKVLRSAHPAGQSLFFRDGRPFAIDGLDPAIIDLGTGQPVGLRHREIFETKRPAFSADGTLMAETQPSGDLALWDVKTGDRKQLIRRAGSPERDHKAFSPSGRLIAAMDGDLLKVWNVADLKVKAKAGLAAQFFYFEDEDTVIVVTRDGSLVKWPTRGHPVAAGCRLPDLPAEEGAPALWAVDAGKRLVQSGSLHSSYELDGKTRVWDVASCSRVPALEANEEFQAISPGGPVALASSSGRRRRSGDLTARRVGPWTSAIPR
jgi:WD40 repeat protein